MYEIDRISSGIEGLDSALNGGLVKGSATLLTGRPGTGKTLFCASFIFDGAKRGEPGVYITTEEREDDIRTDIVGAFGWDVEEMEKKNLIKIITVTPSAQPKGDASEANKFMHAYISDMKNTIGQAIKELNAKRIVIDSLSMMEMFIENPYEARVAILNMMNALKENGLTMMFTSGIPMRPTQKEMESMPEFLVDSVIMLDFVPVAERYNRTLTILKMRKSSHSSLIHPFLITDNGLELPEVKKVQRDDTD